MQESGVIKGQSAQLERDSLGLGFVVYAFIKLVTPTREALNKFEAIMRVWPEVMLCECMTGAADYLIKVVTTDVQGYDRFLRDKLLATGMVAPHRRPYDQGHNQAALAGIGGRVVGFKPWLPLPVRFRQLAGVRDGTHKSR